MLIQSPCLVSYQSDLCNNFIAQQQNISRDEASDLRRKALALVSGEQTSPFADYDKDTLAVACLASDRLIRPGHDSDCTACVDACTQESGGAVCDLYCTRWKSSAAQTSQSRMPRRTTEKTIQVHTDTDGQLFVPMTMVTAQTIINDNPLVLVLKIIYKILVFCGILLIGYLIILPLITLVMYYTGIHAFFRSRSAIYRSINHWCKTKRSFILWYNPFSSQNRTRYSLASS